MSIDAQGRQQFAKKKEIAEYISKMIAQHKEIVLSELLGEKHEHDSEEYGAFIGWLASISKEQLLSIPNICKAVTDLELKENPAFVLRAAAEMLDETHLVRFLRNDYQDYLDYIMPRLPQTAYIEKCICKKEPVVSEGKVFCQNPDCIIHTMRIELESIDAWNEHMCKTQGKPYEKKQSVSEPALLGIDEETTPEWTQEDNEKLEFLYKAGKTTADLAEIFNTTEEDIALRIEVGWNDAAVETIVTEGHDHGSI